MFPHIFKSELFLDYYNKMIDYLIFCEKHTLAKSIDNVLLVVKNISNTKQMIFMIMGKVLKSRYRYLWINESDTIQTQNVNGHITTSWELFTKHNNNYNYSLPILNTGVVKEVSENNVPIKVFTSDDIENIPCRFKYFKDLIQNHERMNNNSEICINKYKNNSEKISSIKQFNEEI